MALSPSSTPPLTKFRALSFDIFGTIIDEPTSIPIALTQQNSPHPSNPPAKQNTTPQIAPHRPPPGRGGAVRMFEQVRQLGKVRRVRAAR